jgi:hypothetical protein
MVLAVAVSVIAAVGLAASVNYAFALASSTQTSTSSNNQACENMTQPSLILPEVVQLKENGTTSINGTTYWYVSFIPVFVNGTTLVIFHGVTFTFSIPLVDRNGNPTQSVGSEWVVDNFTEITIAQYADGSRCGYMLPSVKIAFGDGSSANYNTETTIVNGNTAHTIFDKPTSNPWFTPHTSPQAGVGYQSLGGSLTLYVSTS